MALLESIKGSTLLENLIAAALLLILFATAGTMINNMLANSVNSNQSVFLNQVKEAEYLILNSEQSLPYSIESDKNQAFFKKDNDFLEVNVALNGKTYTKKICCIPNP